VEVEEGGGHNYQVGKCSKNTFRTAHFVYRTAQYKKAELVKSVSDKSKFADCRYQVVKSSIL